MPTPATLPSDPTALIRSREYRVLLVVASFVGLLVSAASWAFLELVHELQTGVYEELPGKLGFDTVPAWWPLPWLALAGLLTAIAIQRLPGHGGHVPADGLKTGGPLMKPIELPGVLLAAIATLGLGLVLGPEAPLIALGVGLGILSMKLLKKDAPGSGTRPDGGRGQLRGRVDDLRLARDRSRPHHRGHGSRRRCAASRAAPRPPCRRDRVARLHRPRLVVGLQQQRLAAEPFRSAPVRCAGLRRLRLDDRCSRSRRRSSCSRSWSSRAGRSGSSSGIRTR